MHTIIRMKFATQVCSSSERREWADNSVHLDTNASSQEEERRTEAAADRRVNGRQHVVRAAGVSVVLASHRHAPVGLFSDCARARVCVACCLVNMYQ